MNAALLVLTAGAVVISAESNGTIASRPLLDEYPLNTGEAIGGWDPATEDYPWLVGVYRPGEKDKKIFEQICGGSLIEADVVLSAAHCFWHDGDTIPIEDYRITAGNYFRDFYSTEVKQTFRVGNIVIHDRYRDLELNYAHDIAIVFLDDRANIAVPNVKPIAIDWNSEFDDLNLEGQSGIVTGWGFTDNDLPSPTRVAVSLPYIKFDVCWKAVPQQFRSFVTPDKFCAGHRNGTAVCPGDSGGGLAFKGETNNTWYLRGIVSVGVTSKGPEPCHKSQYSAFTSIAANYLWLKNNLNGDSIRDLLVPPAVGGWDPIKKDFPWLVGIYRARHEGSEVFEHRCGGSLVGKDVVLTAAHCFWNGGGKIPIDEYRITAGNYFREFTAFEDKEVLKVKNVTLHRRYRDVDLNYAHDLAIVWLEKNVDTEKPEIKPIAIDWNIEFDDVDLNGQNGVAVGWGFTDNDLPSTNRVAVRLPYVDFEDCWSTVPLGFRVFVTPDKFCAGLHNGTAVCPGDSGGGLAFWDPKSKVWYLRGIVSVGVTPKGEDRCFKTQYSTFTSIAANYVWLRRNLNIKKSSNGNSDIFFPDD